MPNLIDVEALPRGWQLASGSVKASETERWIFPGSIDPGSLRWGEDGFGAKAEALNARCERLLCADLRSFANAVSDGDFAPKADLLAAEFA